MQSVKAKIYNKSTDRLFEAILLLKDVSECERFFEDLCTISEIKELAQRLEVAQMLREKKTYMEISEITGASTATISRVNRSLNYGAEGYTIILDRLIKSEQPEEKED